MAVAVASISEVVVVDVVVVVVEDSVSTVVVVVADVVVPVVDSVVVTRLLSVDATVVAVRPRQLQTEESFEAGCRVRALLGRSGHAPSFLRLSVTAGGGM